MTATIASVELELVEYDLESETYRAQYDQDMTSASMAVVAALAEVMDTDPTELDPLYATVDTDSLNTLVRVRDTTDGDIHVTFTYDEYTVTVSSYGMVAIAPPGQERTEDQNTRMYDK